jgi:hypothetical protein
VSLARALRTVAVVIAAAALADPVVTMGRSTRQPLTIAIIDTPTLALPDVGGTRGEHASRIAENLLGQLSDAFAVTVRHHPLDADADPCPADAVCIVVSDGAKPRGLRPRDGTLGSIRVGSALTPNVAIDAVRSPPHTSHAAQAALLVDLSSAGVGGRTTALGVFDGNVRVGSGSYTWPQIEAATTTVTVRVEWAPIETALRHIRVVASDTGGEATLLDNERHVSIDVIDKSSVVFYEPQPTWNGTFVRRALESDLRFVVASRSRVANAIDVGRDDVRLNSQTLFGAKAGVVLVTSPQLLTAVEVDALDRFARLRGGSVIVLLDSRPAGPIERLLPRVVGERREPKPVQIGDLRATEIILLDRGLAETLIAGIGQEAVVVSTALGHGRIVISGAVDAWRYRTEGDRFASFWRALVADAITAAGDPLIVTLSTTAARTGQYVDVEVEARSPVPMPPVYEAAARLSCARENTPVRLWPSGPHRFAGRVIASAPGQCRVYASVSTLEEASAPLSIDDAAGLPSSDRDDLSPAVLAYGGIPVAAGNEGMLVTQLRALATPTRVRALVRPMRSPLWIVPFALCLSVEWWLRRRHGRT